jgi:8-oxo-dGTP pyrophosphatase MutT (NUDIX family)
VSEYGAGLLIFRPRDGSILMTRRASGESHPGYWDFTGGGVEEGETELQAAIREGREELGGLPRLKVGTEPDWWAPSPFFAFALFLAQMDASGDGWEPSLSDEHDLYGWFSLKQLPSPMLEGAQAGARYFFPT